MEHYLVDVFRILHHRLLYALRTVFLPVSADEQRLEAAHHIQEILVAHIPHVPSMEPAVHYGLGCGLRVLPIAGHHILPAYDNLPFLAVRQCLAVGVADFYVHRLHHASRGAEDVLCRGIGRDNRRGLGKSVALVHRDTYGVIIPLKVDVEKGSASDEEFHLSSESLAHALENQLVEQRKERLLPELGDASLVVALLIVGYCHVEGEMIQFLHLGPLGLYSSLYVLLEILGQGRDAQHHGRLQLLYAHRNVPQRLHRSASCRHRTYRGPVGHHRIESGDMGEAVVQRQDYQHPVLRCHAYHRLRLLHIGCVVPVCQEYSLGVSRCTGCIADVGIVVGADGLISLPEHVLMLREEGISHFPDFRQRHLPVPVLVKVVQHYHLLHKREVGKDLPDLRELLCGYHDIFRVGMPDTEHKVIAFLKLD